MDIKLIFVCFLVTTAVSQVFSQNPYRSNGDNTMGLQADEATQRVSTESATGLEIPTRPPIEDDSTQGESAPHTTIVTSKDVSEDDKTTAIVVRNGHDPVGEGSLANDAPVVERNTVNIVAGTEAVQSSSEVQVTSVGIDAVTTRLQSSNSSPFKATVTPEESNPTTTDKESQEDFVSGDSKEETSAIQRITTAAAVHNTAASVPVTAADKPSTTALARPMETTESQPAEFNQTTSEKQKVATAETTAPRQTKESTKESTTKAQTESTTQDPVTQTVSHVFSQNPNPWNEDKVRVCDGTSEQVRPSEQNKSKANHARYLTKYTNCTHVNGNLEIVFLNEPGVNFSLSFLETIVEVTGYVRIANVPTNDFGLSKLKLIRGRQLYKYESSYFSLFISGNDRVKELGLRSLHEISAGKVYLDGNTGLCLHKNIRWDDIIIDYDSCKIVQRQSGHPCEVTCSPECNGNCWGSGPEMCQTLTRLNCHQQCKGKPCFGPGSEECCSSECAGGCTGSKDTHCFACQKFSLDGYKCVAQCPGLTKYDRETHTTILNPDRRYKYGPMCVKRCQPDMLVQSDTCVRRCREGYKNNGEGECLPCKKACPKECGGLSLGQIITNKTVHAFKMCTEIRGDLVITQDSFKGPDPIDVKDLENFENVEVVHGTLIIEGVKKLMSLYFLRNLKKVLGNSRFYDPCLPRCWFELFYEHCNRTCKSDWNRLDCMMSCLYDRLEASCWERCRSICYGRCFSFRRYYDWSCLNERTCLTDRYGIQRFDFNGLYVLGSDIEFLELLSLEEVSDLFYLQGNRNLCYVNHRSRGYFISNKDHNKCEEEGKVCHPQCKNGCMGPGNEMCRECRSFRYKNACIESCGTNSSRFDAGSGTCEDCHSECVNGCKGPGNTNCSDCRNYQDGQYCVGKCLEGKYIGENNVCKDCSPNCVKGCTGPRNSVGPNACTTCVLAVLSDEDNGIDRCLSRNDTCPDAYFEQTIPTDIDHPVLKYMRGRRVCKRCHPYCSSCFGSGLSNECTVCKYYRKNSTETKLGTCTKNCDQGFYRNNETRQCDICDFQCTACYGPGNQNCSVCKAFRVYLENDIPVNEDRYNVELFNCTDECPTQKRYTIKKVIDGHKQIICMNYGIKADRIDTTKYFSIGITGGALLLFGIIIIAGIAYCKQRSKEKILLIAAKMTGLIEEEQIVPSDVKPDMSKLRIVKETELRRGSIIGSGAFGTVHKGAWIPENENVKIPVAIKVLQEGTSANMSRELLDEARVMSSVNHPCCIRILAVCLTQEVMLITQLMPLGCLLGYIRKNKDRIGSKPLLTWCSQIAKGMTYLEVKGIVHRDLAARNVLMHSPTHVKITDFGLAKLINHTEEVTDGKEKLPYKWLALESIHRRIFTHKSDVWAFGVTAWELFSYGETPYQDVKARDVPQILDKGERLPQPPICTIDVYMTLIKCWMVDAESRPSFKELTEGFTKMSRDPGRFLVVSGDDLMRLPDHDTYDPRELLRSMDVDTDGYEQIVDGEEYLSPESDASIIPAYDAVASTSADLGYEYVQTDGTDTQPVVEPNTCLIREETSDGYVVDDPQGQLVRRSEDEANQLQTGNPSTVSDYLEPSSDKTAYMDLLRNPRDTSDPSGTVYIPLELRTSYMSMDVHSDAIDVLPVRTLDECSIPGGTSDDDLRGEVAPPTHDDEGQALQVGNPSTNMDDYLEPSSDKTAYMDLQLNPRDSSDNVDPSGNVYIPLEPRTSYLAMDGASPVEIDP